MNGESGRTIAATVIVASILLLVIIGVLALAVLLWPI
jgi:hypothetical protein